MQVTIEIDLGTLADEWEPVAYRPPKDGEYYLSPEGHACDSTMSGGYMSFLIVRRKWVWPSWLKARWYAEDADGSQWAYTQRPAAGDGIWETAGVIHADLGRWADIPKIGGDWRQSLRENPNWKATNEH